MLAARYLVLLFLVQSLHANEFAETQPLAPQMIETLKNSKCSIDDINDTTCKEVFKSRACEIKDPEKVVSIEEAIYRRFFGNAARLNAETTKMLRSLLPTAAQTTLGKNFPSRTKKNAPELKVGDDSIELMRLLRGEHFASKWKMVERNSLDTEVDGSTISVVGMLETPEGDMARVACITLGNTVTMAQQVLKLNLCADLNKNLADIKNLRLHDYLDSLDHGEYMKMNPKKSFSLKRKGGSVSAYACYINRDMF